MPIGPDKRAAWLRRGLDGFLRQPSWFQAALLLGAGLRLYFVIFTQGTCDVAIWQQHAERINEIGLVAYYHENPLANHPPLMSEIGALLLQLAKFSGIPFRVLLRLPFAAMDAGTLALLLALLRDDPKRRLLAAAYWLNPLAVLFSAYHGNTDSAVAFSALLAVWFLSKGKVAAGAIAVGIGLGIKLPVILAVPALMFWLEGWGRRFELIAIAAVTALVTGLPAILTDAHAVYANVFGYHGQQLHSTGGIPVWGWFRVLVQDGILVAKQPEAIPKPLLFLFDRSWELAIGLLLIMTWRRRSRRSATQVCATIAAGYTVIYGFSDSWAFQYFAWAVPFWFFLPDRFWVPATLLAGGYIYSLYWFVCGNPFLLGAWNFTGHPQWPAIVMVFRDLAVLFFLICAGWFVVQSFLPLKLSKPAAANSDRERCGCP